jgi:hypothetical protein
MEGAQRRCTDSGLDERKAVKERYSSLLMNEKINPPRSLIESHASVSTTANNRRLKS